MKRATFSTALAAVLMVFASLPTAAQEAPFIGVVTEDKVDVRSGAGRAYYVVGELKKGDMARVEKVLFNQTWYQIRVPQNVNSYVSKAFVDAQGDGEKGTINQDRTEFKAASLRGPGESYRVQGTLSKGDAVTILAEEGNFYKIAPPKDAFVFIPAGTLRKATAEDLEAAGDDKTDKPDGTDKPTEPVKPVEPIKPVEPVKLVEPDSTDGPDGTDKPVEPGTQIPDHRDPNDGQVKEPGSIGQPDTAQIPTPPSTDGWPKAPEVEVETPARSDALKTVENKVLPYFSLPIEKQPLDKMAAAYQNLQAYDLPGIDEQIIEVRLRLIERRQQIVATMEKAKAAQKNTQARTVITAKEDLEPLPDRFTAVGLLMPSTVYDGGSLPLLYRVVDASPAARTLAYVAPSDKLEVGAMLNQLVGVVGKTSYDRALKLNVITIDRVVMLEPEAEKAPAQEEAEETDEEATEEPAK
ncbi:MAG: hypothetical protein KTR15_15905 [Phycisphaeraceae bacterium]|nr:hypothetical protein [Phycisphaeraceae bacterium]